MPRERISYNLYMKLWGVAHMLSSRLQCTTNFIYSFEEPQSLSIYTIKDRQKKFTTIYCSKFEDFEHIIFF